MPGQTFILEGRKYFARCVRKKQHVAALGGLSLA